MYFIWERLSKWGFCCYFSCYCSWAQIMRNVLKSTTQIYLMLSSHLPTGRTTHAALAPTCGRPYNNSRGRSVVLSLEFRKGGQEEAHIHIFTTLTTTNYCHFRVRFAFNRQCLGVYAWSKESIPLHTVTYNPCDYECTNRFLRQMWIIKPNELAYIACWRVLVLMCLGVHSFYYPQESRYSRRWNAKHEAVEKYLLGLT